MLSYAFKALNENGYKNIQPEKFHNTEELFATLLVTGMSIQIKRGLVKEYVVKQEAMSNLRGKIEISASIKDALLLKKEMLCSYDDFTVNSYMNRIIKSTMLLLVKANISVEIKKKMRQVLLLLADVEEINLHSVRWKFNYNRNNQTYHMLLAICYLTVKGLLQSKDAGNTNVMDFFDEQRMCRLYEKFILEYYRKEWPNIKAEPSRIPWQLDDGFDELLPVMQTDITLTKGNKVLIIDAKYYQSALQERFGAHSVISGNLYQIFTYVKNKAEDLRRMGQECSVAGMLLYAKTDEVISIKHNTYSMSGNKISVATLDLNSDFGYIKKCLDDIATVCFDVKK